METAESDFKKFVEQKYSNVLSCWMNALDPQKNMKIASHQFSRACKNMGYQGDYKAVFRMIDKDQSDLITLEEFDRLGGVRCAQLTFWSRKMMGSVDRLVARIEAKCGGVTEASWVDTLIKLGFPAISDPITVQERRYVESLVTSDDDPYAAARFLFRGLVQSDQTGHSKRIRRGDLNHLDRWRFPEWLIVAADPEALDEWLLSVALRWESYIRAWHLELDADNSGRLSWGEFKEAGIGMGFPDEKLPGVWAAVDDDTSGWISLEEIHAASFNVLADFRSWAFGRFGSMKALFEAMDLDSGGSIGFGEFKKACLKNYLSGDLRLLFDGLDFDGDGSNVHLVDQCGILDFSR